MTMEEYGSDREIWHANLRAGRGSAETHTAWPKLSRDVEVPHPSRAGIWPREGHDYTIKQFVLVHTVEVGGGEWGHRSTYS